MAAAGNTRGWRRRAAPVPDRLGPDESAFIAEQDSFTSPPLGKPGGHMSSIAAGAKGFLKVIDDHTIAFADFRGNKQFVSYRQLGHRQSGGLDHGRLPGPGAPEDFGTSRDFRGRAGAGVDRNACGSRVART